MADQTGNTGAPPPGRAYEVLTPGELLGAFQIEKCISFDLLGSLYRVKHQSRDERRCILVLPPLAKSDRQFVERFQQQSSVLCNLDHTHILGYQESIQLEGRLCFFLEDFDGRNLTDHLERYASRRTRVPFATSSEGKSELVADQESGLPVERTATILTQVLEAIDHAHKQGIKHLNLNPTNILIEKNDEVKVTAFGILDMAGAKLFDALASAGIPPISVGQKRIRLNTVDILSPEMRLGQPGDQRSDIYALGITAYWLLTGQKPRANYQPPSTLNPSIPKGWDVFIARCLEREPARRYPSAAAALRDLRSIDSLTPGGTAPDPGTRETRTIFRHIDMIPVPKAIERRSPLAARAIRLSAIGLIGLPLFWLATNQILSMLQDAEEGAPPPVIASKPTAESPPANARFILNPPNAVIEFPESELSFLNQKGDIELVVEPGEHEFIVTSPGYLPYATAYTFTKAKQEVAVNLRPKWAAVTIQARPGVQVTVTDTSGHTKSLGTVPASGKLTVNEEVVEGSYTFQYSHENYQALAVPDVNLRFNHPNLQKINLAPKPAQLAVTSTEPKNLTLSMDGKVLGQTPITLENLPADELVIIDFSHPEHKSGHFSLTLPANAKDSLRLPPIPYKVGSFAPSVTLGGNKPTREQLESITLTLTNQRTGVTLDPAPALDGVNPSLQDRTLPIGEYKAVVAHPDYFPLEKTITVQADRTERVDFALEPRPARLTIEVRPEGVPFQIALNGNPVTVQGKVLALPPDREIQIQLSARDHYTLEKTIRTAPNETVHWDADLVPLPRPEPGKEYAVPYLGLELAWAPPGEFTMGTPLREHRRMPTEGPETTVEVPNGFWMGKHEVTQAQYRYIMDENPASVRGANLPVSNVSLADARAFAQRLNQREARAGRLPSGYVYRLPTEAEWEYAARAGTTTPFHFGEKASPAIANVQLYYPEDEEPEQRVTAAQRALPVGTFRPNEWGLTEIHGNVSEWTRTPYRSRLPGRTTSAHETESTDEEEARYVVRGGSYSEPARDARSGARGRGTDPSARTSSIGFRIVLAPETQ